MSATFSGSSTIGLTLVSNPETITGQITVASGNAVYGAAGTSWTLVNDGTLRGTQGYGVYFAGGGEIINHGSLAGRYTAVLIASGGTLVNSGVINVLSNYGTGARLYNGYLLNQSGGTLAGSNGVFLTSGTIVNAGNIVSSGKYGSGVLLEGGLLNNQAGGLISGRYGIELEGPGTVINAGTIAGTGTGAALRFGGPGGTLVLDPGGVIEGSIAGFSAGDVIEVAGESITGASFAGGVLTLTANGTVVEALTLSGQFASNAFTLSPDGALGTQVTLGQAIFTGDNTIGLNLTAPATTLAAGATVSGAYAGVEGFFGTPWLFVNDGTVLARPEAYAIGILMETGISTIVNAAGALVEAGTGIEFSGGTLVEAGTIIGEAGIAIQLDSASATAQITLDQGAAITGALQGFITGDTIDFAGITATSESFVNGTITLSNGPDKLATLALAGHFSTVDFGLTADGHGGTEVTLVPRQTISGTYTAGFTVSAAYTSFTSQAMVSNSYTAVLTPFERSLTVVNDGHLMSTNTFTTAVYEGGGSFTNQAAGFISGGNGVIIDGGNFENDGVIIGFTASGAGVIDFSSGTLLNAAGGTITGFTGVQHDDGTIINDGSIGSNATASGVGISLTGAGLVENNGTVTGITGIAQSYGTAVNSGLVSGTGASIYQSYTEVALRQAGGQFTNAITGTLAAPVGVTLSNGVLLNEGKILGIPGAYMAGLYGPLYPYPGYGVVETGGLLSNASTGLIAGATGVFLKGGMLVDAGTIASTAATGGIAVLFSANPATLVLDPGASLVGAIGGFVPGDVLDFAGQSITSETFSNGILTLANAGVVLDTVSLAGHFLTNEFTLTADGNAGTEVTLGSDILIGSYGSGITLTAIVTTIASTAVVHAPTGDSLVYGSMARDWTLVNSGAVTGTVSGYGEGVAILGSGYLYNAAGAAIIADFDGVFMGESFRGVRDTAVNRGTIEATSTYINATALAFGYNGNISNLAGGLIEGKTGIDIAFNGTILNQGSVIATDGTAGVGINLGDTGLIINQGLIESQGLAVQFRNPGTLVIDPGSTIIGAIGNFLSGDTLDFAGQILTSATLNGNVLTLESNGVVRDTLTLTGQLQNEEFTLSSDGAGGTDVTLGNELISGTFSDGLVLSAAHTTLAAGSSVYFGPGAANVSQSAITVNTNAELVLYNGGSITNSSVYGSGVNTSYLLLHNLQGGYIGGSGGVRIYGGTLGGGIDNAGIILGSRSSGYAVNLVSGTLNNMVTGTITATGVAAFIYNATVLNAGLIQGAYAGVDFFGAYGHVTNAAGATIIGTIGIEGGEETTIANAGTIESALGSAGVAVALGNFLPRLIVDPGAVFIGSISAAGTLPRVLEFAPGSGSLGGIGETVTGFDTIQFDAGAAWTISGNTTGLASGEIINGFTFGDAIILDGFTPSSDSYVAGTGLILSDGVTTATLDITTSLSGDITLVSTPEGTAVELLCYLRGTNLLTPEGERRVESLAIGDALVTRFGGVQRIKWIGRQDFAQRFVANNPDKLPVRFHAGALGGGLPRRDLYVSPGHSVLLDGVLLLAKCAVNGITITQDEAPAEIGYYLIEFETHDCVLAEGLWAESFADGPGLRNAFHNAADFRARYPAYRQPDTLTLCAPRPEAGAALAKSLGPVVARAARGLALGPLRGYLERVTPQGVVEGWAQDLASPLLPQMLTIWCGSKILGSVLACDYRGDLAQAGIGLGRCHFAFHAPHPLSPAEIAGITVCRGADGAPLALAVPLAATG